jgi:peptide/nickel transport system permease protein
MIGYIGRRLLALVPLLVIISFVVFSLVLLLPGDPARAIAGGATADEATVQAVREKLHLDEPFPAQYARWAGNAVTGDLGESWFEQRSVASEIAARFPVTLSMVVGGVVVAVAIGVPLGLLAGTRPGSAVDRLVTGVTSLGVAMPDFWLAIILVTVFAVDRNLLPSGGYVPLWDDPTEWARHLVLPWIAIGVGGSATIARQLRGALADELQSDYTRTARAKGLAPRTVTMKHALKNAAMPAVTVLGIQIAYALGGTVIMEQIFGIPGMGSYALQALGNRDLPVIQGVVMLTAVIFLLMNLVVDVVYAYLNPKVRLGARA